MFVLDLIKQDVQINSVSVLTLMAYLHSHCTFGFCAVVKCCVYTGNKIIFGKGTQLVVTARKSFFFFCLQISNF